MFHFCNLALNISYCCFSGTIADLELYLLYLSSHAFKLTFISQRHLKMTCIFWACDSAWSYHLFSWDLAYSTWTDRYCNILYSLTEKHLPHTSKLEITMMKQYLTVFTQGSSLSWKWKSNFSLTRTHIKRLQRGILCDSYIFLTISSLQLCELKSPRKYIWGKVVQVFSYKIKFYLTEIEMEMLRKLQR